MSHLHRANFVAIGYLDQRPSHVASSKLQTSTPVDQPKHKITCNPSAGSESVDVLISAAGQEMGGMRMKCMLCGAPSGCEFHDQGDTGVSRHCGSKGRPKSMAVAGDSQSIPKKIT
jgi:hypothetical protein